MTSLEKNIKRAVAAMNSKVTMHPLVFLTESDLQSALYSELLPSYGSLVPATRTRAWGRGEGRPLRAFLSSRLHTEFLLPEGRIDLAILDLSATWFTFGPGGSLGHVQLEPGAHAFIELKATRTHRSSVTCRSVWLKKLRSDLEKLSQYPWLSYVLAYDFDMLLAPKQILSLRRFAAPQTRLVYLTVKERTFFLPK
jgi:hypothetical protein